MDSSDELCLAFFRAQGIERSPSHALAMVLENAIAVGARAWADLRVDRTAFVEFLGDRIPAELDPIDALPRRALADLYLAFACLSGDPRAAVRLEQLYMKQLPERLVRHGIPRDLASETVQQLRVRLLVGQRPILRAFSGTGDLHGWMRVTALRAALRGQRKQRHDADEREASMLADAAGDPALQHQRAHYQHEFRAAFAEAVASLSVRERNLLKHSVLHGATSDDLGAIYQVHRSTAARWLAAARERLVAETKKRMIEKLRISRSEYDSILRLIHSQLDVSVARLFG